MSRYREQLLRAACGLSLVTLLLPMGILICYNWARARAALQLTTIAESIALPTLRSAFEECLWSAAAVALGLAIGMHLARMPERSPAERWLRVLVCLIAGAPPFMLFRSPLGSDHTLLQVMIVFPLVVMLTETLVRRVPRGVSDAALSLGVPHWRASLSAVLPCAWPNIARGVAIVLALVMFHGPAWFPGEDAAVTSLQSLVWSGFAVVTYGTLRSVLPSLRLLR